MGKETYFFSHDFEPTSDPKIQSLIGEFGAVGYGIFWRIVEMLHSEETHKIPKKEYIYIALSKQMLTSVEQTKSIVDFCCNVSELFSTDDKYIWSERVFRNLQKRKDISEKRSKAGKLSAKNRANVEQVLTSVEQNSTNTNKGKERKGKEIKGNNIKEGDEIFFLKNEIPVKKPSFEEVHALFVRNGKSESEARVFYNHHEGLGWMKGITPIVNWAAIANNWIANPISQKQNIQQTTGVKTEKL